MDLQVVTKKQAKDAGAKRYFTGLLCSRGHLAERTVSDGKCVECSRIAAAEKRAADPEKYRQAMRDSYLRNSEKRRECARERYAGDPDKHRERARNKYASSINASRARIRDGYASNPEMHRQYARVHYAENSERFRAAARARYAADPVRHRSFAKRQRAARKHGVPSWFGELDALVWAEAADLAQRREAATGFPWHADHMIPLRARQASGLHTWNNCQVIPARLNMFKKNKLILTEPGEWLTQLGS